MKIASRSNAERSRQTTESLLIAARRLFVEKGFAETGTPELVAAAGVTRGALYHHFADKKALFRAVVECEMQAVALAISKSAASNAFDALIEGGRAFMKAMAHEGRTRLLLIEAPAVLGYDEVGMLDRRHGGQTLADGLAEAMARGEIAVQPIEPLIHLLSALYDHAALAIEMGIDKDHLDAAIEQMLIGLRPR